MSSTPSSEKPFTISIPDSALTLLQEKLALTTLPDELDAVEWEYGVPLSDIRRLLSRWKNGYDWRKHERALNDELPQFTRDIEVDDYGKLNIHYVHKRSEVGGGNAIPLLFVHGWPGSFIEARKILPLLVNPPTESEHPAFHVVAFSLPGYGFSEAPNKKGFGLDQFAEIGHKLMLALGYDEYVTQGGDWGYAVTCKMARKYGGTHHKAWHTNFPMTTPPHPINRPFILIRHLLSYIPLSFFKYTQQEQAGLERSMWMNERGLGYFTQQSTCPQTLGYGLTDSPVGLLAWIYEKLVVWTDGYKWDDDEVLTWISIYYFSRAGPTASLRIYKEVAMAKPHFFQNQHNTTIPMGYSYFPKELVSLPRSWLRSPNLIFESEHDSGGHFAAHEKPQELVEDLRKMFGKGGPAFGVVPGKAGYTS